MMEKKSKDKSLKSSLRLFDEPVQSKNPESSDGFIANSYKIVYMPNRKKKRGQQNG